MDGVLLLDKPQGPTSHDLVDVVRRAAHVRRVGHGGTLDPMATGVMVLLVGRATRLQPLVQNQPKTYEAEIGLGRQTDSADAWGDVVTESPVPACSAEQVADALASFVGPLEQVPPAYSAVHVQGRRAYWWARRGIAVSAASRTVRIHAAELLSLGPTSLRCRVVCSSGTYVRTLAEQIAQRLGTVGHVTRLARTAVGPWTLEHARSLDWLRRAAVDEIVATMLPLLDVVAQLEPAARSA